MAQREFIRLQDGEAIIAEDDNERSREQIMLVADEDGYPPNSILAKFTAGANSGMWGKFVPGGTDGIGVARGYLYERRRASTGTQRAVALVRNARLNGKKLEWHGATAPQIAAAIAQLKSLDTTNAYGNIQVAY